MSYEPILLYNQDGTFVGYTIREPSVLKLQTTNIYAQDEVEKLNARLQELNDTVDLRSFWPHPQDPEVNALLDDPTFIPIEYIETEVVDDDRSNYIWEQVEEVDENGIPVRGPDGKPVMINGENLDRVASVINYKMAKVPKRPTDQLWRLKKASEIVARKRAGLET